MELKNLSKADSRVLAQVFDPESAPGRAEILINPDLPIDRQILDSGGLAKLKAREKQAIAIVEAFESSQRSDRSKDEAYRSALAVLDELLLEQPKYASARNNRAQLRRWRFGDRNTLCQPQGNINRERNRAGLAAVEDLRLSLSLASPERPQDAVSPAQGRLLAQAYTQLGALYYAAHKDLETSDGNAVQVVQIDGYMWSRERLEDEAAKLFYLGGLYGNEVAKALAVHTNPHAKLCGSIVKEAMRKEWEGFAG